MKNHPEVFNALATRHAIKAEPYLLAEWNMNRYFNVAADNFPSEDLSAFDNEIFPIESICAVPRPTKGISKARIGESVVAPAYHPDFPARYYVTSVDDVYKYWTSPVETDSLGVFPLHTDGFTSVRPHIIYSQAVSINKIHIGLENNWSSPKDYHIRVQYGPGGVWTQIGPNNPTINNDGTINLYYNIDTWTTIKPTSLVEPPLISINGVMLWVDSLQGGRDIQGRPTTYLIKNIDDTGYTEYTTDGKASYFNLIEIAACREEDLSDRILSVDDTFDMSDISELYPIGTLTSNDATLNLSNLYVDETGNSQIGYFSKSDPDGRYKGILDPNVTFILKYLFHIDGSVIPVQQFEMYGSDWMGTTEDSVSIELRDYSKFLEEVFPRPAMWEGLTVPQIVQRVLDSVGFTNWVVDEDDRQVTQTIPVYWVTGEQNVWEVLNGLAKGTQSAIYFDAYGKLQVRTRITAYDDAKEASLELRGIDIGANLANISSIEQTDTQEVNHVTVFYKATRWDDFNNGSPSMQLVWEPEGTVVLRATELTKNIDAASDYMSISAAEAKVWPYSGLVQVESEVIRYNGKEFIYYTGDLGETRNTVAITSADEHQQYNSKTVREFRAKNHYTGRLYIPYREGTTIRDRGVWNSPINNHNVSISGYSVRRLINGERKTSSGLVQIRQESLGRLTCKAKARAGEYTLATQGAPTSNGYFHYGTRMRFVKQKGLPDQMAGIVIHNQDLREDGYYVEFRPSSKITSKSRKFRGELILYSRKDGKVKRFGPAKGANISIREGAFFEVDISYTAVSNDHRLSIWVNGKNAITATITQESGFKNPWNGRFGMFVHGKSKADYDYLYASNRNDPEPPDDFSFFDMVEGGYMGGQWDRELVYGWRTMTHRKQVLSTKNQSRWTGKYFDEFGPILHEIREYDVKFDPSPVLHSRLYMTNTSAAVCPEYRSTPFGADFIIANTKRRNAVINGEDNSLPGQRTVNQLLTVIGRVLVIADNEEVVVEDTEAIKKNGKVPVELESEWIQSKSAAEEISTWMASHWSDGADQQQVEIFGNPLVEVGDVVTINYPERFMLPSTHRYFVVSVSNAFESGISTRLTLRRVVGG